MNFSDSVILVTGGSRGIGRSVAQIFSQHGGHVVIHYNHDETAAEQTLLSLNGKNHMLAQCDMKDPAGIEKMVNNVIKKMGKIDILVNNAGIYGYHPVTEVDYIQWQEEWHKIITTNLMGPANLTFLVAKQMIKKRHGRIISISSRGAFRGEPKVPAYGASKAGLNAMNQSLAQILAPFNIFVFVIAPGFVETDMTTSMLTGPGGETIRKQSPLGRVAQPEEIAYTVLFLSSEKTDYLTGAVIDMNGASYLRT